MLRIFIMSLRQFLLKSILVPTPAFDKLIFGRNIRKLGATFKEKISILVFLKHKFVPHKIIILPLKKYLLRWHDIFVLWFAGNTYLWNKNASLCSEQLPGMQSNNHGVRVKFKRRCNKNKKQKKVRSVVIVAYQQNE